MSILFTILSFILTLVIILGIYVLCRKFIFTKVRINKWIPLSIAIVLFIAQMFLPTNNVYVRYILPLFPVLFFLWFMDIMQTGKAKKNEKQIIIKPKAKPNRVRNKNK
ncbi:hypothetical protein [Clostridium saccharobutylicum]|uniref:Uncharacterized protein n=1 Tax=Clostridium saccharobutylicum DSM 13864 TaxID=1345695 RepID=U5MP24_CLOSA|nr:hypothetical protein [Clostridium saccharobutylicum]AGX42278.1 hypothetical protein CLSA_c12750 [Clostridium saccharobutylicum DSM 13864]AQR89559.1 hypothetical protein CLOSC_12620 [Clostridium saccharobutylicum]AQR99461.1 hypothetical protein CSACC_12700 [Clostridium saccharobutylicum]AQS09193.1 hypothetical protein CLOBY_13160 [Clostridium saccharobutylicum]AQS13447.1 hypothetical protein CLOSACC_12700 [Clostridium saccharobutylicum]